MRFVDAATRYFGLGADSFSAWRALLAGALDGVSSPTFTALTGLEHAPSQRPRELWLAIGRRGGKDYVGIRVLAWLALLLEWPLSIGETGVVMLLAVDRAQARVAFTYLRGLLESDPVLLAEVANITADTIQLENGVEIQITTSDHAAVRGRTVLCALLDEYAFWGAEQALEVLRALRPAQATQANAMLIIISSVYSQSGPFFEAYRAHYGHADPRALFALATSQQLNPTLPDAFIAAELARDPAAASAEYLSQFRSDLAQFLDAALIDGCTRSGPRELPFAAHSPTGGPVTHHCGLDVSGGRGDSTACAIARRVGERVVIAAVRRFPSPHDPLSIAQEVATFAGAYGCSSAIADAYAAEFATSTYRKAGLALVPAEVNRSEAYLHLLPLLTSGRIELPADPTLRTELLALERRTGRAGGRDVVDHPPHGSDDVSNSVALAAYAASRRSASEGVVEAGASTIFDEYHHAGAAGMPAPWDL